MFTHVHLSYLISLSRGDQRHMDSEAERLVINLNELSVVAAPIKLAPPSTQKKRHNGYFVKGPIPMSWLEEAMGLPGRALHVAIEIWFQAGLRRSKTVPVSQTRLAGLGFSRASASRGLEALERAGLIAVERHRGCRASVTILKAEQPSKTKASEPTP
jgi:hypothetical protein